MGTNPILKKAAPIEKEILEVWKAVYPVTTYVQGFEQYAGKILVPSEEIAVNVEKKIENLKDKTSDKGHVKFLNSIYVDLDFYEPYRVPSNATDAFFYHLAKEGINVKHMKSLATYTCKALKQARTWLAKSKWPIEIRIITKQKTDGMIGIVNTIKNDATNDSLKQELEKGVLRCRMVLKGGWSCAIDRKRIVPARLQKYNRVQIPTLVRWKHKLEPGEVLYVRVYNPESYHDEEFYARVLKGGRITIPKLTAELLEIEPGDIVYVTLYAEKPPGEEEG